VIVYEKHFFMFSIIFAQNAPAELVKQLSVGQRIDHEPSKEKYETMVAPFKAVQQKLHPEAKNIHLVC